ncbi:PRA1 family protein E-like, partial [Amaranthus tricolor]|uniref:PRA1 family protein E-like n=1 Tax=Amaranthus tricolor TaxID=29722 RepID=UPI0025855C70
NLPLKQQFNSNTLFSPKIKKNVFKSTPTIPNYGTIPTTTTAANSASSVDTFITRTTHQTRTLISHRRPWREFLSLSSLSLPTSYSESMARIRRNINYFRFNYSLIILTILFLSLLWHPISMIVFLAIFVLWIFLYLSRDDPVVVFGRSIDDRIVLLGLSIITILALVFTKVGLNVLISLIIGVVIVGLHAAFRSVDDLFLDEDDVVDGGLISVSEGQPLRPTYAIV